jgi:hypothetical protein
LLGIHFSPKRKIFGPTFKIRGIPSSKMKKVIKANTKMEEKAIRRRAFSIILSCSCMVIPS